jgi:hypothetical protein
LCKSESASRVYRPPSLISSQLLLFQFHLLKKCWIWERGMLGRGACRLRSNSSFPFSYIFYLIKRFYLHRERKRGWLKEKEEKEEKKNSWLCFRVFTVNIKRCERKLMKNLFLFNLLQLIHLHIHESKR